MAMLRLNLHKANKAKHIKTIGEEIKKYSKKQNPSNTYRQNRQNKIQKALKKNDAYICYNDGSYVKYDPSILKIKLHESKSDNSKLRISVPKFDNIKYLENYFKVPQDTDPYPPRRSIYDQAGQDYGYLDDNALKFLAYYLMKNCR